MRVLVELNSLWQPSEDEIFIILQNASVWGLNVNSVDRALFSGRYEVQVDTTLSRDEIRQIFSSLLDQSGYPGAEIKFEGSSGGLALIGETAESLQWPIIIVAVAVVAVVLKAGK